MRVRVRQNAPPDGEHTQQICKMVHLSNEAVRWATRSISAMTPMGSPELLGLKAENAMQSDVVEDLRSKLNVAAEALRKAEERALAGQFALEVMHEIRNPLEAVGYLVHLATDEEDPAAVREYLRQAEEQMATVHQIAAQTLGFARLLPTPQEVDLIELAEAALRIHHRRITAQKIHLVRDFSEQAFAEIYTGEILQVVSNLLANALDALPEGGTISLRLRKRGSQVQLLVADNGQGMAPDHVARLFEPFFTTKQDRGTGLGLALSKKIIERHTGTISARSSHLPRRNGTTFRITLPVKLTNEAAHS
jgi:signal transduction histidine kinase